MVDVAVLGAGITGTLLAIRLAESGNRVMLFDQAPAAMAAASRWNEGRIHLGYLYAADPTGATAAKMLDGGLAFFPILERVLGGPIAAESATTRDDIILVHRDSVASADEIAAYFQRVASMAASHSRAGDYPANLIDGPPRRLANAELEEIADPALIDAAFEVPERSVSTNRIADRLVSRLAATPGIECVFDHRVTAAEAADDSMEGPFAIKTEQREFQGFAMVFNTLWEGRIAIDASLGIPPPCEWSHRFRLALFARTNQPTDLRSATIAVGPFGDVKNYDGRSLYLSWYPAGLQVTTTDLEPGGFNGLDDRRKLALINDSLDALSALMPGVAALRPDLDDIRVEGGWIYAAGTGLLDERASSIHRRDRIGVERRGNYFSIDTGKYSVGPWLADHVANLVAGS